MELILTCKQCGHEERGESERMLMTKIRMWNHLNHAHRPSPINTFKQEVEESAAV